MIFKMDKCGMCEKPAVESCYQCGIPLCKDHIEHGIQFRTNEPVINCPNCKSKISRLSRKLSLILSAIFIVITIVVLIYLNSIFSFL